MTTTEIKAQVFDILVAMENLQNQLKQLEGMKQETLQKLQEVQNATIEQPAVISE